MYEASGYERIEQTLGIEILPYIQDVIKKA